MRSVMKHRFSEVATVDIPRSTFDRSHGLKTTFDGSYLVPVLVDEILPGDTVKCNMTGLVRLSTPTYPVMDNIFLDTFFFFVPNRLVWSNWKRFMGERDPDPDSSIDYTVPYTTINNNNNHSIADYMGIPTKVAANNTVNALPFRAYYRIWNEWFRDENLQDSDSRGTATGDGPDSNPGTGVVSVLKRCKRHDYFTSGLPDTQKGDAVTLPLGTSAPIYGDGLDFDSVEDTDNIVQVRDAIASSTQRGLFGDGTYVYGSASQQGSGELRTDLSSATAATINELREAFQVQRLLEKDMRSGSRYTELLRSHFGITSSDQRLQRPEYLGGGSTRINFNPVAQTDTSVGDLGAFGVGGFTGHGFVKSFEEHGYLIGLVNCRADLTYQEGLERFWSRSTRYDFYTPVLAHLGEMAVLNKEIYVDATDLGDGTSEEVFSYQEAWADYRYKPSRVSGKFRSNDTATLDGWHLSVEFGDTPTLDDTFIEDTADTTIDRVIVTATEPQFIMDSYFKYIHTRCMPTYSIPGYIDHF